MLIGKLDNSQSGILVMENLAYDNFCPDVDEGYTLSRCRVKVWLFQEFTASFLMRVSAALQEEYRKLPTADREGIRSFHILHCLVRQPGDQNQAYPALHPTELVLVQLACFIT